MIKLYAQNNSSKSLDRIVRLLEDGGVIIFPTDTVYAFGCHALKERAVERICKLRGISPKEHPLSIICYDLSAVSTYCRIDTPVFKLMKRNLPGCFTFVLPGRSNLPKAFQLRPGREVGVRMPDVPLLQEILEQLGAPLMTASLPVRDDDPAFRLNPELVEETYGELADLVIDGGDGCMGESTVVDCTGDAPEILRQGIGELK